MNRSICSLLLSCLATATASAQLTFNLGNPTGVAQSPAPVSHPRVVIGPSHVDMVYVVDRELTYAHSPGDETFSTMVLPNAASTFDADLLRRGAEVFVVTAEGNGLDADLKVRVIAGNVVTGPFDVPARTPANTVSRPRLLLDASTGDVLLFHLENTDGDRTFDVAFTRFPSGDTIPQPVILDNPPGIDSRLVAVDQGPSGDIHVVFQQRTGGSRDPSCLAHFVTEDGGGSWRREPDITGFASTGLVTDVDLDITGTDGDDVLFVAWNDLAGTQGDVFVARNSGSGWTVVGTDTPDIADRGAKVQANGHVVALAYESRNPTTFQWEYRLRTSGDGGITFANVPTPIIGGSVSGTTIAYDGDQIAVATTANRPPPMPATDLLIAVSGRLTHFEQITAGGCGPGGPGWIAGGDLNAISTLTLDTAAPDAPVVLVVSPRFAPTPFRFGNCVIQLDLSLAIVVPSVADAGGRVSIDLPPGSGQPFAALLEAGALSPSGELDLSGVIRVGNR